MLVFIYVNHNMLSIMLSDYLFFVPIIKYMHMLD